MDMNIENVLIVAAAVPGMYGFICWIRRSFNAQRAARWVKETHHEEWNSLHWLAQRNPWAGVEVLVTRGLISGQELDVFRARDEYLEKASWIGILVSAALLLVIIVWKLIGTVFS